ncbi:dihydroxyacetone kinase subunit L [Cohnella sp. LGH]|uniref:dihydroxyacetone kinase subunit DhaL n=1 Tax=Cohnella sp. LGH TaxID=1619153 RepID=UPI001AD9B165|nr:dihydroxyacetone kinase subunit DhaL [Cohnella sp. LGH]QTH42686.1 dihydroxyacetone kinase subunit L [Cohnella sp. LGH]
MILTASDWKRIWTEIGERIEEKKEELCDLDRVIGDGDHGISMAIGWQAIREDLARLEREEDLGALMRSVSRTFLNAVGASVGPLYGTAFLRGSAVLIGKEEAEAEDVMRFWIAVANGIQQMGKAQIGDKTMLDTWLPIAASLESSLEAGEACEPALDKAAEAGRIGMEATRDLISRLGRSGRLGERSKGHIDPGAASAYVLFSAFVDACKRLKGASST